MAYNTIAISTSIAAVIGLGSFLVQYRHIRFHLLADRKNERRHQAVLEALRALSRVIANEKIKLTGYEVAWQRGDADTALRALRARLTHREQAEFDEVFNAMKAEAKPARFCVQMQNILIGWLD